MAGLSPGLAALICALRECLGHRARWVPAVGVGGAVPALTRAVVFPRGAGCRPGSRRHAGAAAGGVPQVGPGLGSWGPGLGSWCSGLGSGGRSAGVWGLGDVVLGFGVFGGVLLSFGVWGARLWGLGM